MRFISNLYIAPINEWITSFILYLNMNSQIQIKKHDYNNKVLGHLHVPLPAKMA